MFAETVQVKEITDFKFGSLGEKKPFKNLESVHGTYPKIYDFFS